MRQRIDITDMEVRTKIRAKYLRALENEEWDLLPGPTYVKSFLRTYADALGLDSRALVEEYKLRHERMDTGELHPIRRPTARERDRRRSTGGEGIPRAAIVAFILAAIVAALAIVGQTGGDDEDSGSLPPPPTTSTSASKPKSRHPPRNTTAPAKPKTVRLQLVPTGPVSVCLVNAAGTILIGNQILQPGRPSKTFRSKRFRVVLGNNAVTMKINGKQRTVPPSSTIIAYSVSPKGRHDLPQGQRPTCQ
jgi:cytoskeleton protein RodZ